MRRDIIVEKLIAEGLSEKTLVKLNDKQLNELAERMLGEAITTTMAAIQKSPTLQAAAKDKNQTLNVVGEEDVTEVLKGNQKKIDKNHNGKIDAEDFKILKGKKKEKKGDVVEKTTPKKKVAAAAMWKSVQKEGISTKIWVENITENELYHNFTSKNEIIELIQNKLNESKKVTKDSFMDAKDIKNVITTHLRKNK
jgi:hypothetical protein